MSRWLGRCPGCEAWDTLIEEVPSPAAPAADPFGFDALALAGGEVPVPLAEVICGQAAHRPTGIGELDRVLGGGFVPGSTVLLGGEPGIGKSTLTLQALQAVSGGGGRGLLVTAEESKEQVRLRAERLGPLSPGMLVAAEDSVAAIVKMIGETAPTLVVVDSIQTVRDPRLEGAPGSVAQVRESAAVLVRAAKAAGVALVLVGHVTKDGALAGPRVLEHLVDVVCAFEGDRHHSLRILRAAKNRFGPVGELGVFDMRSDGLAEVADASGLFLAGRRADVAGSAVVVALEGRRPLLVEVQALTAEKSAAIPRRSVSGLDPNRVALLLGVLERRLLLPATGQDVYVSAAGGVRLCDPAADLGVCAAIVSALFGVPVPAEAAFVGEVGLGAEVRAVPAIERRVSEAVRLGFTRVLVPAAAADAAVSAAGGAEVVAVAHVADAVAAMAASCEAGS